MILKTWSGSYIDTKEYSGRWIYWAWAKGWVRYTWRKMIGGNK